MADLLSLHGFRGTFYMPLSNREGLPVMSPAGMRRLGQAFEIGSHTIDHCRLTSGLSTEARRQIAGGKEQIEQVLGYGVTGFCYVNGQYTFAHRQMVIDAGFEYARTITSLHRTLPADPFVMPTTIQYYPHTRHACVRHFIRRGEWGQRTALLRVSLEYGDFLARLRAVLDHVCLHGGVFHLWGHSWELDAFDGWRHLDDFLRYAADRIPPDDRLTNHELLLRTAAQRRDHPVLGVAQ
jgi:peptidoglycan/xylan/chitin deacetylase (PgdA/CDA1 family)